MRFSLTWFFPGPKNRVKGGVPVHILGLEGPIFFTDFTVFLRNHTLFTTQVTYVWLQCLKVTVMGDAHDSNENHHTIFKY